MPVKPATAQDASGETPRMTLNMLARQCELHWHMPPKSRGRNQFRAPQRFECKVKSRQAHEWSLIGLRPCRFAVALD
ncbi:hypothetical protein [Ottowia massiliensis]|uniref:hypothetical protein n=1 Tax=Ottowia massiliensis TaxID=2045302 RepID=UPI0011AF8CC0|nr:hypothetical protein [Ottowia massiliensis]